ncbi:hypothetical protein EON67_10280 [archaeon]|nr:MAG: hypothetical protein EON67_10280 [archaeon]
MAAWDLMTLWCVCVYACTRARACLQAPEDRALLERLELAVERISDADPAVVKTALELMRKEIRESTR